MTKRISITNPVRKIALHLSISSKTSFPSLVAKSSHTISNSWASSYPSEIFRLHKNFSASKFAILPIELTGSAVEATQGQCRGKVTLISETNYVYDVNVVLHQAVPERKIHREREGGGGCRARTSGKLHNGTDLYFRENANCMFSVSTTPEL